IPYQCAGRPNGCLPTLARIEQFICQVEVTRLVVPEKSHRFNQRVIGRYVHRFQVIEMIKPLENASVETVKKFQFLIDTYRSIIFDIVNGDEISRSVNGFQELIALYAVCRK